MLFFYKPRRNSLHVPTFYAYYKLVLSKLQSILHTESPLGIFVSETFKLLCDARRLVFRRLSKIKLKINCVLVIPIFIILLTISRQVPNFLMA